MAPPSLTWSCCLHGSPRRESFDVLTEASGNGASTSGIMRVERNLVVWTRQLEFEFRKEKWVSKSGESRVILDATGVLSEFYNHLLPCPAFSFATGGLGMSLGKEVRARLPAADKRAQ
jgi:hypothetical protein